MIRPQYLLNLNDLTSTTERDKTTLVGETPILCDSINFCKAYFVKDLGIITVFPCFSGNSRARQEMTFSQQMQSVTLQLCKLWQIMRTTKLYYWLHSWRAHKFRKIKRFSRCSCVPKNTITILLPLRFNDNLVCMGCSKAEVTMSELICNTRPYGCLIQLPQSSYLIYNLCCDWFHSCRRSMKVMQ